MVQVVTTQKILFNKKQDGEHDPETNLTDNRYESAVLIQNQNNFTVGRLTVEHAYDSSDYTKDNEFYRKGNHTLTFKRYLCKRFFKCYDQ